MSRPLTIDPMASARNYHHRRMETALARQVGVAPLITSGDDDAEAITTWNELPESPDAEDVGEIIRIQTTNEAESDRYVTAVPQPDGSLVWQDVNQGANAWPAPYVGKWGSAGTGNGQFSTIRGIAVNPANGDVYVASDNRIQRFSANGTYISTIATAGSGNGQVNAPGGLDIYNGTLYVADSGNLRVQALTLTGGYLSQTAYLASPLDVVFVPGPGGGGPFSSEIGGITFDVARLRYWSTDRRDFAYNITGYPVSGSPVITIGEPGSAKGTFNLPYDVALDAQGNVHVTDTGNNRVQVFDNNGIFQGAYGQKGSGDDDFDSPTAIAITNDYIYVADSGNSRVVIRANPAARPQNDGFTVDFWIYTPGTAGTAYQFLNMPAAETEYQSVGLNRRYADLTGMTEAQFSARVNAVGSAGSTLRVQYSTDNVTFQTIAASGVLSIPATATGEIVSAWTPIAAGAKAGVYLRVTGAGGNATADPQFLMASVAFR